MGNVVVTGGSGRLGYWAIRELLQEGHHVISGDQAAPKHSLCPSVLVDLNQMEQVLRLLEQADEVIHLAAIPAPGILSNEETYRNNTISSYNVLEAADQLGIRKVVIGSSASIYGFAYAKHPFLPDYFPVDENHPLLPQECYGLSKIVNEQTAAMFNRRSDMQIVSLRMSCILSEDVYFDFCNRPDLEKIMYPLFWSYVDVRDAARACRLGIEASGLGAMPLEICANDTLSREKTKDLYSKYYSQVTDIRTTLEGHTSLSSNQKARQSLNWQPQFSWRMYV
ncbi:NAD-dependent epimerase/dehydratase family protein [Paenibacillus montanisoli]|uniref:NAD(P)-dependent oxidoreductase n=1 Tax=Paenibacillus montanisoli TaxID=2081970 RepID=A0A328UD11_9BACL|nr:NAD(P)-dependent oxidoreductase [Paenibacillus montanisoli]RAP77936.1 NAD(P)-dependent oxidoreductase [Paenibacillus montanisoli]